MSKGMFATPLARDLPASVVVFLVALPLSMGIAIASGVPAEKGLLTGIIGGIVHGMLAGIGVLIVAGQIHVLLDAKPQAGGLANILAAPGAYARLLPLDGSVDEVALGLGLLTIAAMVGWEKLRPRHLRLVPGALIGVTLATVAATLLALPVAHVRVPENLWDSLAPVAPADLLAVLGDPGMLVRAAAIAFIASAETLLSAAAVDRMHDGARTRYNRELAAQGLGNFLCGLVGALPMTGVIVRSSANVQAGAVSRLSTILHGVWILAAVLLLPWLLRLVPMAALAGVLVVTGYRLVGVAHVRHLLHRHGRLPVAVWAVTLVTVVASDLLTGVVLGIALSLVEMLPLLWWRHAAPRRLKVETRQEDPAAWSVTLSGAASVVSLPRLALALEGVPEARAVTVRMNKVRFIDHTCVELVSDWMDRRRASGARVVIDDGADPLHQPFVARLRGQAA